MRLIQANDFIFNGSRLSDFGFHVISTESGELSRKFGVSRTIEKNNVIDGSFSINNITQNIDSFEIFIGKINENSGTMKANSVDLYEINRWLFQPKDYKELIPLKNEGLEVVYYAIFTDSEIVCFGDHANYIKLTFEINSNHGYGTREEKVVVVDVDVKQIYIDVIDNIEDYIYPSIDFVVESSGFTITNETLGEEIVFSDLIESVYRDGSIYGDNMFFVVSKSDYTINMREKSNKKFLRLVHGRNVISIRGNGTYTFRMQPKLALQ